MRYANINLPDRGYLTTAHNRIFPDLFIHFLYVYIYINRIWAYRYFRAYVCVIFFIHYFDAVKNRRNNKRRPRREFFPPMEFKFVLENIKIVFRLWRGKIITWFIRIDFVLRFPPFRIQWWRSYGNPDYFVVKYFFNCVVSEIHNTIYILSVVWVTINLYYWLSISENSTIRHWKNFSSRSLCHITNETFSEQYIKCYT